MLFVCGRPVGRQQLVLVVTDAGDGGGFDHADRAGARLVR